MKKMKKKQIILILLAFVLAAGGTGVWFRFFHKNSKEAIVLKKGQTMITAQVSSIVGNDISLALVKEYSSDSNNRSDKSDRGSVSGAGMGMPPEGNMPKDVSGDAMRMPDRSSAGESQSNSDGRQTPPSGMPQMDGQGFFGQSDSSNDRSQGKDENSTQKRTDKANQNQGKNDSSTQKETNVYQLTGETADYTIPVGTKVTTSLGAVTSFARIQAEDIVRVVLEKNEKGEQVIVGIWIVG